MTSNAPSDLVIISFQAINGLQEIKYLGESTSSNCVILIRTGSTVRKRSYWRLGTFSCFGLGGTRPGTKGVTRAIRERCLLLYTCMDDIMLR